MPLYVVGTTQGGTGERVNPFDQIARSDRARSRGTRRPGQRTSPSRWLGSSTSPASVVSHIATAAQLHDIGKIKIDLEILNKPGPLDTSEWDELERHSQLGYDMIHKKVDPEVSSMVL